MENRSVLIRVRNDRRIWSSVGTIWVVEALFVLLLWRVTKFYMCVNECLSNQIPKE